jgi:hypothetical protein
MTCLSAPSSDRVASSIVQLADFSSKVAARIAEIWILDRSRNSLDPSHRTYKARQRIGEKGLETSPTMLRLGKV